MKTRIGESVVVGRYFREMAQAEVIAHGADGRPILRLSQKFRDLSKGTLLEPTAEDVILPLEAPAKGNGKSAKQDQSTDKAAPKTAKILADQYNWQWPVGSRVLFGSKKHPILGEVVRFGRVGGNYVVKALEDYGKTTTGKEVYVLEAELRPAPQAATPKTRKSQADKTAQTASAPAVQAHA